MKISPIKYWLYKLYFQDNYIIITAVKKKWVHSTGVTCRLLVIAGKNTQHSSDYIEKYYSL